MVRSRYTGKVTAHLPSALLPLTGTPEARTPEAALAWARVLLAGPALRESLNARVLVNARAGLYDGCKTAAALALAPAR
jgi:hypothetical protein